MTTPERGMTEKMAWFKTLVPPLCCPDCEHKALIRARELFEETSNELDQWKLEAEKLEKALDVICQKECDNQDDCVVSMNRLADLTLSQFRYFKEKMK